MNPAEIIERFATEALTHPVGSHVARAAILWLLDAIREPSEAVILEVAKRRHKDWGQDRRTWGKLEEDEREAWIEDTNEIVLLLIDALKRGVAG